MEPKLSKDNDFLHGLRAHELATVTTLLGMDGVGIEGKTVLEIGAGDGFLAARLAEIAEVTAIDIPGASHGGARLFPVTDYDGEHIPYPDGSFDVVFSSNVLEHIAHIIAFQSEIHRVLKPGGVAVHVVPSASWRIWTSLAHYPALPKNIWRRLGGGGGSGGSGEGIGGAGQSLLGTLIWRVLLPGRHGEIGNGFGEIFRFSRGRWIELFRSTGWQISQARPSRLFYTGHTLMGTWLPMGARRCLAALLGSATHIFVLAPAAYDASSGDGASPPPGP